VLHLDGRDVVQGLLLIQPLEGNILKRSNAQKVAHIQGNLGVCAHDRLGSPASSTLQASQNAPLTIAAYADLRNPKCTVQRSCRREGCAVGEGVAGM
jgi:hypothetical protein